MNNRYYFIDCGECYHHGIKGQRWGVRRFQNEDGTLTDKGKKRYMNSDGSLNDKGKKFISERYKKYQSAGDENLKRDYQQLYVDSHNEMADHMNEGLIDAFNKTQERKYGKNFAERDGYEEDFYKMADLVFKKVMSARISDYIKKDPNYQKAKSLVKQYSMLDWDQTAKNNSSAIEQWKQLGGR